MSTTQFPFVLLVVALAGCAAPAPSPSPVSPLPVESQANRNIGVDQAGNEGLAASVVPSNSVLFEKGRAEIDAVGMSVLRAQAEIITAGEGVRVTLVGYTDELGSAAYNLAVASKRVDAVFNALRALGVPPKLMRKFAVGNEKASRQCRTETCRKFLRRVTIEYGSDRSARRASSPKK